MDIYLRSLTISRSCREDANFFLEIRGDFVRLAQGKPVFHFEVQLDKEASFEFLRSEAVDRKPAALRGGADGVEKMFVGAGARLHVNHHVRGKNLAHAALDGVADLVHALETCRARDADGDIHEMFVAGAAEPHAFGAEDALHLRDGVCDFFLQAFRRCVKQRVDCAPAQA